MPPKNEVLKDMQQILSIDKMSKKRSIDKYKNDEEHKEKIKKGSIERYATDEQHRNDTKRKSIQKYELNSEHRENVKARSKLKYKLDEMHRMQVSSSSTKRYRENENYRKTKLDTAAKKYENDDLFRTKRKTSSKEQYKSRATTKAHVKERVKNRRILQLKNREEVVRLFKEKAMQGINYSCCCCDRLLFQNQVKKCERNNYAGNEQTANVANLSIQEKYSHKCTETCAQNCIKSNLWICFTCHRKILSGNVLAEPQQTKCPLKKFQKNFKN